MVILIISSKFDNVKSSNFLRHEPCFALVYGLTKQLKYGIVGSFKGISFKTIDSLKGADMITEVWQLLLVLSGIIVVYITALILLFKILERRQK